MKKDDIEVGVEYAASPYTDYRRHWSSVTKVKVTGPAETRKPSTLWDAAQISMVPVTYPDGEPEYGRLGPWVPIRQIREPWADYEAAKKKAEEAKALSEAAQAAARQTRLELAAKLAQCLRDAGMPDSSVAINRRFDNVNDYIEAGFKVTQAENGGSTLTAPLSGALVAYVESNKEPSMPMPDALWLAQSAAVHGTVPREEQG